SLRPCRRAGARRYSAVDVQRGEPIGTDPLFDARKVCDAAMYSVDYEQGTAKDTYPHDHIALPFVACHFISEAVDSKVVGLVRGRVERLAAFPIDCSQLAKRLVIGVDVAHEAGKQRRRVN